MTAASIIAAALLTQQGMPRYQRSPIDPTGDVNVPRSHSVRARDRLCHRPR
jgi:hypothetical protein